MAKKNLEETAEKILRLIGGPENVSIFTHCVTRLRFTVKDMGLVQSDAIGRTPASSAPSGWENSSRSLSAAM